MAGLLAFSMASATEMLSDNSFESGGIGWYRIVDQVSDAITYRTNMTGGGIDASFLLVSGGAYAYNAQMLQTMLSVRPGYRYTVSLAGSATSDGAKPMDFGIQHNGGNGAYDGDGSGIWTYYDTMMITLPTTYAQFSKSWDNCSVTDAGVQFYIHGGGNSRDAYISWVSLDETPISCGASSSSVSSVATSSVAGSSSSVTTSSSSFSPSNATTRLNQVAFAANGMKRAAILLGNSDPIVVKNSGNVVVATATVSAAKTWAPSGESVRLADFSDVTTPGTYSLWQGSTKISANFNVSATPYSTLLDASLKFYYFQRASTALLSTNAGSYARAAGHPDNSISKTLAGQSGYLSAPKGWYDAGDYGKYVVNSGISTYTLLALYEHFSTFFASRTWNLPESGNAVPDLLDEIRWNLDWMRAMQDADGGVFHKLTSKNFCGAVMPAYDDSVRFIFMKTTAASYDFAAVMATASRLYQTIDPTFASASLQAARDAYTWALAHPTTYYVQPSGVTTGTYDDNVVTDEKLWAAAELYLATQEASFLSDMHSLSIPAKVPEWAYVGTLGYYTIATHSSKFPQADVTAAQDSVLKLADTLRARAETSGYGVPMANADYIWGSNGMAGNQGVVLLHAYYINRETGYLNAARQSLDYLLGRNPLNKSFVTGYGTSTPLNPHHRPSQADGISAPVPGMVVGGPQPGGEDIGVNSWECPNYLVANKPALSYYDNTCSYATNEVTINWNAPLAYLAGALEAIAEGQDFQGDTGYTPPSGTVVQKVVAPVIGSRVLFRKNQLQIQVGEHLYDVLGHRLR